MMHGKAIWKRGIGEIAKPHTRGAYSAPYEPLEAMANVLTRVGLWPAIKLNPS